MSSKQGEVRTIHKRAITALGQEACVALLSVARDLRSGAISPESYDQLYWCGTSCCIGGHLAARLGILDPQEVEDRLNEFMDRDPALFGNPYGLFGDDAHSPTPVKAADAIERYVYDGWKFPWSEYLTDM